MDTLRLSHLEQTAYFAALRQGVHILDAERVSQLLRVSRPHAVNLLASMARKGALHRVGRGQYVVIPSDVLYQRRSYVADPYQVVDELMKGDGGPDYYVAYQSAALVHGAAYQLPQALLVAVPSQRRAISLGNSQILFVQVRPEKFFGYQETTYHGSFFQVSDREKTILDCLDRFDLCGGIEEVARTTSSLVTQADADRLLAYLPRMRNQALTQRLGLILERLAGQQAISDRLLDGLAAQVGRHVYSLDPHGPADGPVHPRWRIRENIAPAEET
ncbi:MAG: type IV toxin-antitoxin system AbiEi family antitoxin [Anaerolineae bacterium]